MISGYWVVRFFLLSRAVQVSLSFSLLVGDDGSAVTILRNTLQKEASDSTTLPREFLSAAAAAEDHQWSVSLRSASFPECKQTLFDSADEYLEYTEKRHAACQELFDRYRCKLLRCEELMGSKIDHYQQKEINIRWESSWISASSVWLFNLAETIGWDIDLQCPDPTKISTFSWKRVGKMFQVAFQTGTMTLPVYTVQGSTRLSVDERKKCLHLLESIDLVEEADRLRLQNRLVAQELASWLDVSRRPPLPLEAADEWASIVRQRILTNVPGAGALDIDPNDNDDGPEAVYAFGITCFAAFMLLYQVLNHEISSGQGGVFLT
eukprot:scaffold22677_cov139-Cylindrotheca_fusiformis.AAC.6